MNTEQLIAALAQDVPPVRRHVVARRIAFGAIVGGVVAAMLVVATLGMRPDLDTAMHGFPFWMKTIYTASLGACAVFATMRLARPAPASLRGLWLMTIPVGLLAVIGIGEMAAAPAGARLAMWLGRSWMLCPWLVLGFAVPIFIGLLWSFRRLAPTRLRAAGAAAGLAAGAWSATVYCLHCPEVSAMFVLTWYSLGILLAAALGALIGPRVLRW